MNLSRLEKLPDWPARMTAEVAASYMGISKTTFLIRYGDQGVREGANLLWARVQLDRLIARQFSIPHPAGGTAAVERDDSWDDLR